MNGALAEVFSTTRLSYPALIEWLLLLLAPLFGALLFRLLRPLLLRLVQPLPVVGAMTRQAIAPLTWLAPVLPFQVALRAVDLEGGLIGVARHIVALVLIGLTTWLALRLIRGIGDAVEASYPRNVADNLQARRIQTQSRVLMRTAMTLVTMIGMATALMTFPPVRTVGASLLASAGLAGIVAGIAARPVLSNLIAGMQIALTQPIRLDDVLIVEGEWGWVEEITSSYVVLRIWDLRRLIVPLQWFIEHPFQNWTRSSAEIIGTVFWWVDYRMPLAPLREQLERLCRTSPEWDGKLALLQVTDSTERAIQLRALVSARNSPDSWDLRCRVREGMIDFIQRHYPDYLPRLRGELNESAPPVTPSSTP